MQPLDILIFISVVAIVFLLAQLVGGGGNQRKRIERIRARRGGEAVKKTEADMSLRRKTNEPKGLSYWLSKPLPDFKRIGDKLERAGKTISPKHYMLRRLLWMIGIAFLIKALLGKSLLFGLFVGIILGVWLPIKLLQRRINKQNKAFLKLFPDAIDLIVRGLRSGLPVSESMVLVASELPDPVHSLFSNISNTMKLGVPMEKALQETARKLDMTEFNFFTTSIVLQRETGGNLSEILNNLSDVLRSRLMMRMKIHAMSSEARASAYIVGSLPFVVMGAVTALNPEYMSPLFNDFRGNIAGLIAASMMGFGGWIMSRMTKFAI